MTTDPNKDIGDTKKSFSRKEVLPYDKALEKARG